MTLREAVLAEARSWLGTPYHPHGRVKGAGVDCAMFLAEVFERVGVLPHVDPGYYPQDWHLHQGRELYLEQLEAAGARRLGPDEAPLPGDVAMFRFGRTASHGAIVLAWPRVIHSFHRLGVLEDLATGGQLRGRLDSLWRVL